MWRTAWLAANLMNMWRAKGSSRITPDKLLGPRRRRRGGKETAAEQAARKSALEEVKALIAPEAAGPPSALVVSDAAFERVWQRSQERAKAAQREDTQRLRSGMS